MTAPWMTGVAHPQTLGKEAKRKKQIFDEQYTAFWGAIGSTVRFNNGKNHRISRLEWRVAEIENDWQNCKWTKGGKMPLFIKLERDVVLAGNKKRVDTCYTFTDALEVPAALSKGRWSK
jgi:hypothetical protein